MLYGQSNKYYGTIHLRRRQIFHDFWSLPPPVGSFLLLSIGQFCKFLTPPPLKNADVLNGWSLGDLAKLAISVKLQKYHRHIGSWISEWHLMSSWGISTQNFNIYSSWPLCSLWALCDQLILLLEFEIDEVQSFRFWTEKGITFNDFFHHLIKSLGSLHKLRLHLGVGRC